MSESFYQLLKQFIWPRYREEGPPKYIDVAFISKDFFDVRGKIKEPVKSLLDLIVLGYRPVTTVSILVALVENENKPMYGTQLGGELEKRFLLPKGWFTKTRYYDSRIGKLLKLLCRLDVLEETEIIDSKTKRRYVGYHIVKAIYPTIRERILNFLQGGNLSFLSPSIDTPTTEEKVKIMKRCSNCNALTSSPAAKYCELCGSTLSIVCPACQRETMSEYSFCLYCGKRL